MQMSDLRDKSKRGGSLTMDVRNLAMPGNPRYQPKEMVPYFGYDNLYRAVAEVLGMILRVDAQRRQDLVQVG